MPVKTGASFTSAAAGLMMGTRTGDLDPGLAPYLLETEGLDAAGLRRLVNHESGLLGVSGISAAIATSVTMAGEPQRHFATEDCAVVNRFTMPCPG